MTTTIATLWIMVAAATATGASQDPLPDWPERTIRFEKIDDPLETPIAQFGSVMVRPKFAATLVVKQKIGDADALSRYANTPGGGSKFLNDAEMNGLSDEQLKVMKSRRWMDAHTVSDQGRWFYGIRNLRSMDPDAAKRFERFAIEGTYFYTIYGVTENDVRVMVRAAAELLDNHARESFERNKAKLPGARKALAERSERVAVLEKPIVAAKQTLQEAQQSVSYTTGDQATVDIRELQKTLRGAEIEIAGIQAKMDAITNFKGRADNDEGTRSMLDRLLMEQDIEMAGALARKTAVESHHNKARVYYQAFDAHRAAVAEHRKLLQRLGGSFVRSLETAVFDPPDKLKPVVLIDDKVVIQPIKYLE